MKTVKIFILIFIETNKLLSMEKPIVPVVMESVCLDDCSVNFSAIDSSKQVELKKKIELNSIEKKLPAIEKQGLREIYEPKTQKLDDPTIITEYDPNHINEELLHLKEEQEFLKKKYEYDLTRSWHEMELKENLKSDSQDAFLQQIFIEKKYIILKDKHH